MNVIKRLEEERKEWEASKEHYEEDHRWYETELARLQAQVAQLESAPPAVAQVVQVAEVSVPVQAHHEQQLKLMQTIDVLRRDLEAERERGRLLEQCMGNNGNDRHLDSTGLDKTMAAAMKPLPQSEDFTSLEDENLQLREELNSSKEKVIQLKKTAAKRSADWRAELQTITEELAAKQALEEEAAILRRDRARLQEDLTRLAQTQGQVESGAKGEIERLKDELQQAQDRIRDMGVKALQADEMDILSQTMGQRVIELEEELARKVGGQSHLISLFVKHAERPLEALRLHCMRLTVAGSAEAPESFIPDPNDIQGSLVNLIELLRWAEELVEGYEEARQQRRSGYPSAGR